MGLRALAPAFMSGRHETAVTLSLFPAKETQGWAQGSVRALHSQQCAVAVSGLAADRNWDALSAPSSIQRQPSLHCSICLASPHSYNCLLAIAYDPNEISGPHKSPQLSAQQLILYLLGIPMPQGLCPGTAEMSLS